MRHACTTLFLGLWLAGCGPRHEQVETISPFSSRVRSDGLVVELSLPKVVLTVGERVQATVTAMNESSKPITIRAESGAPAYLRVWRKAGWAWDQVRRYPQWDLVQMNAWQLAPHSRRQFVISVVVEPDWPVLEQAKITGELNGRADVQAGVVVTILPRWEKVP